MFTAAEGYGLFTQKFDIDKLIVSIDLRCGQLRLKELELELAKAKKIKSAAVKLSGDSVGVNHNMRDGELLLFFNQSIVLKKGQRLDIEVSI